MSTRILNQGNIWQNVYVPIDSDEGSIRVSITSGSPTLPSTVRLADGVDYLTTTVIGGDRALDVNVINALELTISHLDDSIRLGDGTNLLTSTTSGGKTALDVSVINNGIAATPGVANVSMPTANTEYNYTFAINTKKILFKSRNSSPVKFSFISGTSGTTYITVPAGNSYTLDGINPDTTTILYFQSTKNAETLEILYWT
jgi:hypothetical protein